MSFAPGARVRVRAVDPDHHTRVPRYARGHVGEVVEREGEFPLADDRARGLPEPRVQAAYAVRFPAAELWGEGDHTVTLTMWESYLEEAE
ncbi:SH3-like domain-containing protein [Bailinhaonella thermotolerans]|uniref:SH3-like domain-containing protein n=1 Tax=Bailinhaonella thermotolerans TaxID=1070861 RepID=UPI00192A624E